MRVVYVAGKYRDASENAVLQNILRSREVAIWIWQHGAAAISPHMNTALMGGAAPDETWLHGDLEILRRCDGAVILPGWETSEGTKAEIQEAERLGIPVYYWPDDRARLKKWLREE